MSPLRKVLQSLGDQILFRRCFLFFCSIVQLFNQGERKKIYKIIKKKYYRGEKTTILKQFYENTMIHHSVSIILHV